MGMLMLIIIWIHLVAVVVGRSLMSWIVRIHRI